MYAYMFSMMNDSLHCNTALLKIWYYSVQLALEYNNFRVFSPNILGNIFQLQAWCCGPAGTCGPNCETAGTPGLEHSHTDMRLHVGVRMFQPRGI